MRGRLTGLSAAGPPLKGEPADRAVDEGTAQVRVRGGSQRGAPNLRVLRYRLAILLRRRCQSDGRADEAGAKIAGPGGVEAGPDIEDSICESVASCSGVAVKLEDPLGADLVHVRRAQ